MAFIRPQMPSPLGRPAGPVMPPQAPVVQGGMGQGQIPQDPRMQPPVVQGPRMLGSFKKGGKVKKTGAYKLHKGEKVIPLSSLAHAK
jgi:hypothetical protein